METILFALIIFILIVLAALHFYAVKNITERISKLEQPPKYKVGDHYTNKSGEKCMCLSVEWSTITEGIYPCLYSYNGWEYRFINLKTKQLYTV